jgi:hypothetical protein
VLGDDVARRTAVRVTRVLAVALAALVVFVTARIASPEQQAPPGEIQDLTRVENEPATGIALRPPPEGYVPPIDGSEALAIAWREEGRPDATSATASLGLLSATNFEDLNDRPVWQVVYAGVCVRAHGPPQAPDYGECFASEYNVVIDAVTGEFLFAYANEFPGRSTAPMKSPVLGASGATGSDSV